MKASAEIHGGSGELGTLSEHRCRAEVRKLREVGLWSAIAALAYYAAYARAEAGFLSLLYLFGLLQLAQGATWRNAFYPGLVVGLLVSITRLEFFYRIFSGGAVALWLVYAFWIGLFVALARLCIRSFPGLKGWALVPFVWCGLEYFRSELYYLRFSWLSPGYAFGQAPWQVPLKHLGSYGTGFLLMSVACAAAWWWRKSKAGAMATLVLGLGGLWIWGLACASDQKTALGTTVQVAGVQMEFPTENEVLVRLDELIRKRPEAELVVLSEYTLGEPVPERVKAWCRKHRRHLIIGGKEPTPGGNFYNTAFVVGPNGEVVFRQVKSVPIQFFKDGLPAPEQKVWDSPWGKIGICICYDLSYRQVTDRLVRLGAQALVVPTMDVADWGQAQHELHGRVAPVRAAEYGVPIFRIASSGISQLVNRRGHVLGMAPCPGDGAMLAGTLELGAHGTLPVDTWLAPMAVAVTFLLMLTLLARVGLESFRQMRK